MPTQQELDNAAQDALALTSFMTDPAGTANVNSDGTDVGTLEACKNDLLAQGGLPTLVDVAALRADITARQIGERVATQKESAVYNVVDATTPAHIVTAGGVRLRHDDGPYVIVITGQSNAAGSNSDGPNPASDLVRIWDGVTNDWGSSDRTLAPLSRINPHGNSGNNNYALARGHRVSNDTGRPVLIIFDAQGGQAIDEWVANGTASPRYAAVNAKVTAAIASPEMVTAGKAIVDEIIIAQGEADFEADFATYLGKLASLRLQLRAEPWCKSETPIYMMSPSDLHDRYQWRDALKHLCQQVDSCCIFVTSNGLRTEYGQTGAGDFTHFLGESLWEAGYYRIGEAVPAEGSPTFFYGRATGPADATDETAMATFQTLVSRDSWTTEVPPNGPAAVGSISWGQNCAAEGNYSFALGYQCVTDNLANYGMACGRAVTADSGADYFAGFGYQTTLSARYTLVAGRGHTIADEGGTAIGMFSQYTSPQADHVMLQIGIGISSSTRGNALTVRRSGKVELPLLPVFADVAAATTGGLAAGDVFRTAAGDLKIVV